MALKATIYKARLQIADMDRNLYADHELTIARHPSETDERMLVRLLVFALKVPPDNDHGALEFAKDMWDADEPALWEKDFTGRIKHWIEIGQPDDRRIMQSSSRSDRASVYSFTSSTSQWWATIAPKVSRATNLIVWQVKNSQALTALANRSMTLDVTVQDAAIWVGSGEHSVEIGLQSLYGEPNPPK